MDQLSAPVLSRHEGLLEVLDQLEQNHDKHLGSKVFLTGKLQGDDGLSALFVSAKIVPEPLVYNDFRFPPVFSNDTDFSRITRPWSYRNPQC